MRRDMQPPAPQDHAERDQRQYHGAQAQAILLRQRCLLLQHPASRDECHHEPTHGTSPG
ncbi:hypothetical protein CNECB9_3570002 [Cupriavidus necator]|uniref:Uncharacterized protein n=1 Tax=Cupriavidus necator TaxID=106590 RepID=A0A1K0II22_CUPNE|nr:hypothetical protein CNECB9_3570002 [Cupriavidus necator]